MLLRFWKNQAGSSAAEYAIILGVCGMALGAASLTFGQNVGGAVRNSAVDFNTTSVSASGDGALALGNGNQGGNNPSPGTDPGTTDPTPTDPTPPNPGNGGGKCNNPNKPC